MPTLRGTNQQFSTSANSLTVTLPAGSAAGDIAVLLGSSGWTTNTPSGWTVLVPNTGGTWQSGLFWKALSSGDISTGSVTVTFSNSFDCYAALAVFVGGGFTPAVNFAATGSSPQSVTATNYAHAGDVFLYFGSARSAGADTVSRGTLAQQGNDGSSGSGCLYTESISSTSFTPVTATFTYPGGAGSGNFCAIVVASTAAADALVSEVGLSAIVPSPAPKAQLSEVGITAIVPGFTPKAKFSEIGLTIIVPSTGYQEGDVAWMQLRADQRSGSGAYGQSADATGAIGKLPMYGADGLTLTNSGLSAAGLVATPPAMVLLASATASNSAELDFTSAITSTYDLYEVVIVGWTPATNGACALIQFSTNGGSSYDTSSIYDWGHVNASLGTNGSGSNAQANVNGIVIFADSSRTGQANTALPGLNSSFRIYDPLSATNHKNVEGIGQGNYSGNGNRYTFCFGGVYKSTTAVNAFRLIASSGNITAAKVRVYGITNH